MTESLNLRALVGETPFSEPVNAFWTPPDSSENRTSTSFVEGKFILNEEDYRALEDFVSAGLSLPASLTVFQATYPAPDLTIIAPDMPEGLHGEIGTLFVKVHVHAGEYVKGFSGLADLGRSMATFAGQLQSKYNSLYTVLQRVDNTPSEQRVSAEFRRDEKRVPATLQLGPLATQAQRWMDTLQRLKQQFTDLRSETEVHKGTFTSITAALSTIIENIREAIKTKYHEQSEAEKSREQIEEQRSHANRTRNQVLLAGGLVALLGDAHVGFSIAISAAKIQGEYERYKSQRAQVSLTIGELQNAQVVLMREEKVIEAIRLPITQILGCVDEALSAIHKIQEIIRTLLETNDLVAMALEGAIGSLDRGDLEWVIDDLKVACTRWGEVATQAREFSRTEFLGMKRRLEQRC